MQTAGGNASDRESTGRTPLDSHVPPVNLTGRRESGISEFKLLSGFQVSAPTVATLAGLLGNISNCGGWSSFFIVSFGQTMCRKSPDYWVIGPYD